MSKFDDTVLLATRSLESAINATKQDTREQLGKSNLLGINSYCNNILRILKDKDSAGLENVKLLLAGISELTNSYQKSEDFVQTDTDTKNYIHDKLVLALDELYLFASEYYLDVNFNHNVRLEPVLNRIVDRRLRDNIDYFN